MIVDSPPVGLLPDASLLSAFVDGVLLVVRAGKAPFQLVKRTVDSITHDRILGVVMNAIDYRARSQRGRLLRILRRRVLRRAEDQVGDYGQRTDSRRRTGARRR